MTVINLQGNTPEDLLDGTRKGLERVSGLSSCQTNQFSSGEGEGRRDEDGAEALEAMLERTGIIPETSAPVMIIGVLRVRSISRTASKHEDKRNDHEDDSCAELEHGRPEFFLGIS